MPVTSNRQQFLERESLRLREHLERIRRDRSHAENPLDPDFAEQAVQRQNDEVLDQIERAVGVELRQIEHALEQISLGQGENCEACGAPIGPPRLTALPFATQCAVCARYAETNPA